MDSVFIEWVRIYCKTNNNDDESRKSNKPQLLFVLSNKLYLLENSTSVFVYHHQWSLEGSHPPGTAMEIYFPVHYMKLYWTRAHGWVLEPKILEFQ